MSGQTKPLFLGARVVSNDGIVGVVIQPGPYGDSPFQVERFPYPILEANPKRKRVFPFIEADGRSRFNTRVWRVFTEEEALQALTLQAVEELKRAAEGMTQGGMSMRAAWSEFDSAMSKLKTVNRNSPI